MPNINIYFDRHDLWVGAYWRWGADGPWRQLTVYVCPLPMLVIRLRFPEQHAELEPRDEALDQWRYRVMK